MSFGGAMATIVASGVIGGVDVGVGGVAGQATSALVGGNIGFVGGAVSGASGGFVGGSGTAWLGGADFGQGLQQGLIGGAYGAVSGGLIGGISGGITATKNGGKFWSGEGATYDALAATVSGDKIEIGVGMEYTNEYAQTFSDDTFGKNIK